ncbi:MAG: N-acetylglucosamine-6-phosphate deacetylase [Pseudomonadales bacterium]
MPDILLNARVFDGTQILEQHAVIIAQGKVLAVVEDNALPAGDIIDLAGQLLVPGFIDTQVNGGAGVLLNHQPSVDGIKAIAQAHRKFGTTAMLPTLISDDLEIVQQAIDAVREAMSQHVPGIVGIHLEGPFLNPLKKGVHPQEKLRSAEPEQLPLLSALADLGRSVITMAPEVTAPALIDKLRALNIRLSIGHSNADYTQARDALQMGFSAVTHLFNAMPPLLSREPGVIGAALEDDNCYCGIIVDGHHIHPSTLKTAVKAKARGKMFLVTDAVHSVGSTSEELELMGQRIYSRDGKVSTAAGVLAGSNLDMASAVRNCVELLSLPLEEALRMASLYPAHFLGLARTHGRIAAGYNADFALLDQHLNVEATWIGGQFERSGALCGAPVETVVTD